MSEIPVLLDNNGKVMYLSMKKEKPIITTIGKKGYGISIMAHRIMDYYYKAGYKVMHLNDRIEQFDFFEQNLT